MRMISLLLVMMHRRLLIWKCYVRKHFYTKDLWSLRYFLDIEVAKSSGNYSFSEKVCAWYVETDMLGRRVAHAPMKTNIKLLPVQREMGDILDDPWYRQLMGKLNYWTITRPNKYKRGANVEEMPREGWKHNKWKKKQGNRHIFPIKDILY